MAFILSTVFLLLLLFTKKIGWLILLVIFILIFFTLLAVNIIFIGKIIVSAPGAILSRYGLNPSDPVYEYTLQIFNYKTSFTDEDNPRSDERIEKEISGKFKVWYGIHSSQNSALIMQENDEMIVRDGPPFSFGIYFIEVAHNIEAIHFNSVELLSNNTYNLLETDDILLHTSFSYRTDYAVTDQYGIRDKIKGRELLDLFKKDQNILISPLVKNAKEILTNKAKNIPYYASESERNTLIDEGRIDSSISFGNIPINIFEDEEITIVIDVDLIMAGGEVKNLRFDDTYKKQYQVHRMRNRFPPSTYDKQK